MNRGLLLMTPSITSTSGPEPIAKSNPQLRYANHSCPKVEIVIRPTKANSKTINVLRLILSENGGGVPLHGRNDHDREPHDPPCVRDDDPLEFRHGHDRGRADAHDRGHDCGRARDHASRSHGNAHGREHACVRGHADESVRVFLPSSILLCCGIF